MRVGNQAALQELAERIAQADAVVIFNFTHCTGGILYLVAAAYGEAAQRKAWKMCGLSLSGDWNVPIKAAFCPNRRTLFPNSRIWVQTVDEDGFPAYAEDTVK